jgi:transcriptional regulator with XRE-family HTH domain
MALSKISELRQRKGLTQKALADELGMTVAGFQNWEKGKNNKKSIERFAKLCKALGCKPEDLVEVD